MKFDKHGNGHGLDDLYVLPETQEELEKVVAFLKGKGRSFSFFRSTVSGAWEGKMAIDVPFGESLKPEIEKL
jgi:hypothetical protein